MKESLSTCLASSTLVSTGHNDRVVDLALRGPGTICGGGTFPKMYRGQICNLSILNQNCQGHLGSFLRCQAHLGARTHTSNRVPTGASPFSKKHQTCVVPKRARRHRLYQAPLYHGTASFSTFPGHLVKILTCEYRNGMAAMGSKRIAGLL